MAPVLQTCNLVFLVTAVFGLGDHFYTLTNVTSWEHANRSCTLATPRINYSAQGPTLDFGNDLEGVVGEHWVGYTTHNFIFQYIGCSLEADVAGLSIRNYSLRQSRPGVCYSACSAAAFGMKDGHCYCFVRRPDVDVYKQTCTRSCSQQEINCGGTDTVSIFKAANLTLNNFTRVPNGKEYCVAFDPNIKHFIWKDCESQLKTRCQTVSGTHMGSSEASNVWNESAIDCFSKKTNTMSKGLKKSLDFDYVNPLWTGYFRSDHFIRTFNDRGTPVLYGHVYIYDNQGQLAQPQMTFHGDTQDFAAICVKKSAATIFTPPTGSNPTSTPDNRQENYLHDEPTVTWYGVLGFSKMIAIVIITSGIVILLVAVILGVVCVRRRTSNMSEVLHNRGSAAGTDNMEHDARNEEIHEYEEMHEYEGLADRGSSHAYEGDRGSSHAYEGLTDRGPSHAYEGQADRGSSHAYEGLADRGPSHAYEGLTERGSSHAYEGLSDRGLSHAYEGLAERGSSHAYEGLAESDPAHTYEGLAERGPSHEYESMDTESKTVTTTHEERVYLNKSW